MSNPEVSGIIIDFRANQGGTAGLLNAGFALLYNQTVEVYGWDQRCSPADRLSLCTYQLPSVYPIVGNPSTYYDKPIAMLVGPGCISSGDLAAVSISYHPRIKFFGKTTRSGCAYAPSTNIHPDFLLRSAELSPYAAGNPGFYITGNEFPGEGYPWIEFEEVWFTQEGVAQGIDDVVEAAKNWIISFDLDQDGIINEEDNCPEHANIEQTDADEDTVGDACDNCIDTYNPDQEDTNENGIGDVCEFVCGDADNSGVVNILDVVYILNYKYKSGPEPEYLLSADVNSDQLINILDVVFLLNSIYKDGPEPDCLTA
jgi:hypothetical protein